MSFYEGAGDADWVGRGEVKVAVDAGGDVRGEVRPFIAGVGFAGYFDRRRGCDYARSAGGGVAVDGRTC